MLSLILQAIIAVLKFPSAMREFIKLLEKSPEEKRQEIEMQVRLWADESAVSERPKWNE